MKSHRIIIQGLRIYAYHGVMEQERKLGAYFIIDCDVDTDFSLAMETDQLGGTISYADLYDIIRREMAQPSHLLEHAAGRCAKAILTAFSTAQSVHMRMLKENPPMGADCQGAGVEIFIERSTND